MTKIEEMLAVYFIAGTQDIVQGNLFSVLEEALQAGITCFQYREKGAGSLTEPSEIEETARKCQELCRAYKVPFLINDEVELALKIGADGVHVGQSDQAIEEVLRLFDGKIVGLSCETAAHVEKANQLPGISYYGIGPVFGTVSKADAVQPIGVEKLADYARLAQKPVVAIGGISLENGQEVLATGVQGVSVISAITRAESIEEAVEGLKKRK
ncbi:thiamine-phosphate diphosphorylase [Enterococcus sp. JM4C]|uniref:thiamine phosphate synthase n=1 Tax=Candidatus Enterococcus huntleyi TaxID=1857217 RepID=UPI001F01EEC2|nr:thiamine phosphate synthase [Enterococcus sp. JM4C]KAF1298838.1 thiamine-phosphate diphosphorylase [Enterococcus sp. JM4C]